MDEVFKALADPHRRLLLDSLRAHDGQTLEELCTVLPGMTRFGVMKHLKQLELAGVVVTRKDGRRKFHYLNPVPIRLIHDRWISRFRVRTVRALTRLKRDLEEESMEKPKHVYEIYIRATPEQIWDAITRPEWTERYYYGTRVNSTWKVGSDITYSYKDGRVAATGKVLEVNKPRKLVITFDAQWDDGVKPDRPHRETTEIFPMGETCKLVVTSDDFDGHTKTYESVIGGVSVILSGLKSVLETGKPLVVPYA